MKNIKTPNEERKEGHQKRMQEYWAKVKYSAKKNTVETLAALFNIEENGRPKKYEGRDEE